VLDVAKVVQSSLTLLAHEVRRSGVTVDASGVDPAVTCAGDGGKLGQIITNLVNNALDACAGRPGARVPVSAVAAVGVVRVTVADDGPGVPEALRERIFDLLFTTRATQGGTGVGLALSRDLAEGAFGGTLRLVPSERGACFVLEVPRERSPSASTAAPRAAAAPWSPSDPRGGALLLPQR
jgi:two-component system C4-dicarboxylate transport sensor histidine kinase DctB